MKRAILILLAGVCIVLGLLIMFAAVSRAGEVTLAWDPITPDPDGYRVFQRLEGAEYKYDVPVWPREGDDASQTTCTIYDLPENTVMYFVVRAFVGGDMSGDSNEVAFSTRRPVSGSAIDAPTGLTSDEIKAGLARMDGQLGAILRILSEGPLIRPKFCGNPDSHVLHKASHWCRPDAVIYDDPAQAAADGYRGCEVCKPMEGAGGGSE